MTSQLTCQVCLLPLDACRENDIKLIKRFKQRLLIPSYKIVIATKTDCTRKGLAMCYAMGYYNSKLNKAFIECYRRDLKEYIVQIKLPLCVWEGEYDYLGSCLYRIHTYFTERLPITSDYFTILQQLFSDGNDSYLSSLPPPPKPMPTKRLKTN